MTQRPHTGLDANDVVMRGGELSLDEAHLEDVGLPEPAATTAPSNVTPLRDAAARKGPPPAEILPHGVDPLSELANAHRFERDHGAEVMFVRGIGWHGWTGTHWAADEAAAARRMQQVMRDVRAYGLELQAAGERMGGDRGKALQAHGEELADHGRRSQSERGVRSALKLAEAFEGLRVEPSELDRDPMLLAVANGTLDLRTGELRAHAPADRITRAVAVKYDRDAKAPTWERTLERILPDDDVRAFVCRAAGYSLTGSTAEQCLFIAYGPGGNGKSTWLEAIRHVLGPYSAAAQTDTFMRTGTRGADNDLARIRGARMVSAVETVEGRKLDEARIKQLTGGDTIAARFLYREAFEFVPVAKIWIACNHRPEVSEQDEGIWRRLRLIPFDAQISEAEKDRALPEKLKAEAAGILAWAVRGCAEWRGIGLRPPDAVMSCTAEWRRESDAVGQFVADECVVGSYAKAKAGDLFAAFRTWAQGQGIEPGSQRGFGCQLKRLGYTQERTKGDRWWTGLGIQQPTTSERGDA